MPSNLQVMFDMIYSTGAALAENGFDSAATCQFDSSTCTHETFDVPGAPRTFRAGVNNALGQKQP